MKSIIVSVLTILLSQVTFAQTEGVRSPFLLEVQTLFDQGHTPQLGELRLNDSWIKCTSIEATATGRIGQNPAQYYLNLRQYNGLIELKTSFSTPRVLFGYAPTPYSHSELYLSEAGRSVSSDVTSINHRTIRISRKGDLIIELTVGTGKPVDYSNIENYPWFSATFPEERAIWYMFCPANVQ